MEMELFESFGFDVDSDDMKAHLEGIDQLKVIWDKERMNSDDVWQRFPLPVLEKFENDLGYYDLLRKKTHLIGKAGSTADMKIDDYTVSCLHAEISCIKKIVNGKVQLFLQVIDKNSKFGTFVKDKPEDTKEIKNRKNLCPLQRAWNSVFPQFKFTILDSVIQNSPILNALYGEKPEDKKKDDGNSNNSFRRIESGQPILLSHGDTVRFGLNESGCFKFASRDYFISKDDLNEADMNILRKAIMNHPGITFLSNSPKITHYVISNSILKKAILGLATLTPIVTVQYFIDLCKALSPNSLSQLPFTEDFIPDLMENLKSLSSVPVSLDINPIRKHLFIGKKFFCSTKEQLLRVVDIISAAGGGALYHTDCDNLSINDDILNKSGYIFIQQDSNCTKPDEKYQLLLDQLNTLKRRPIPESEIALAVIFVSTEKYCNPQYNLPLVDFKFQSNETQSQVSAAVIPGITEPRLALTGGLLSTFGLGLSRKRPSELMYSHENLGPNKSASLEKK